MAETDEKLPPPSELQIDEGDPGDEEQQIDEYQLSSSPNDFNVVTMASFIESGAIKIPGFQRHYVWDLKRASKLIESLIIGLPIPQIFLYEESQNHFLVIDGQQRLMSLYFFVKQRFPRKEWRTELRRVFNLEGQVPNQLLMNDKFFQKFNLSLPRLADGGANRFHGLNYSTLEQYRTAFDLRTIRNVIVRQIKPSEDDSSIYEMFNRLNSGGVNLRPQEIRASMYHSPFVDLLFELNMRPEWRRMLDSGVADLHMRDIELLLRAAAMHYDGDAYRPSMSAFLNKFSKNRKAAGQRAADEGRALFDRFFTSTDLLDHDTFRTRSGFSVLAFESVFYAALRKDAGRLGALKIDPASVQRLREDPVYRSHAEAKTGDTVNVKGRLARGMALVELK